MKKTLLAGLLALLLPGAVAAQTTYDTIRFPLMTDYDLDSTSYMYCITTGENGRVLAAGRAGAGRIKTSGSSSTVVSYMSGSNALDLLAVGDELEINAGVLNSDNGVDYRSVAAVASDNSITVNAAINLPQTNGHGYRWRQRSCATTGGWFPTKGFGYISVQFEPEGNVATGGIDYQLVCRIAGSDSTGVAVVGPTNVASGTTTPVGMRIQGPWDECRLGIKIGSADDGDGTPESVDAYVELRR